MQRSKDFKFFILTSLLPYFLTSCFLTSYHLILTLNSSAPRDRREDVQDIAGFHFRFIGLSVINYL